MAIRLHDLGYSNERKVATSKAPFVTVVCVASDTSGCDVLPEREDLANK